MNLYESEWYREQIKRVVEDLDKETIKKTVKLKEEQDKKKGVER